MIRHVGSFIVAVGMLLISIGLSAQVLPLRTRIGSFTAPSAPLIQITIPDASIIEVSTAALDVSGLATDDVAVTAVTWTCPQCTGGTSGSATYTAPTWTFSVTLACSSGAGSINTITVTADDGTLQTSTPPRSITCTTPDTTDPTVEVTSPAGAIDGTDATSLTTYTMSGTCQDDVLCTSVVMTCSTCSPTSQSATLSGNGSAWSVGFTPGVGANTVNITAFDEAGNDDIPPSYPLTLTRSLPLQITTGVNLPSCVEDVGGCSRTLSATGGSGSYTWSEVGSALNTGNCAGLTLADVGDTAVVSGTPNPASVPVTCQFVAKVVDGAAAEDEETFFLPIVSATAEDFDDYFEYQVNNRSSCDTAGAGTNCILRLLSKAGGNEACPDGTYGDKGACHLRSQTQLNALGSTGTGDLTTAGRRKFQYASSGDPYVDPQNAAKVIIPGESWGDCPQGEQGVGCADIDGDEQLHAKFPPINTGRLTVIIDAWWGNEWKQSGFDPDLKDAEPGVDCGGQAGSSKRWKHMRMDGTAGGWISITKLDYAQAFAKKYFKLSETDSGWWDCGDNYIAVVGGGAGGLGKNVVTPDSVVAPTDIGIVNNDQTFEPNGTGTYHTFEGKDYPVKAATWTRFIYDLQFHVPADDTQLDPWRTACDSRGDPKWIKTSSVAAATVITTALNHGLQTNDTVYIFNHEGSTPEINGAHTVTKLTNTTFTIPVNVTVAGHDGIVTKDNTSAIDTECANMLTTIPNPDSASIWNLHSLFLCDETRSCQALNFKVPWHTMAGTDTDPVDTAMNVLRAAELDGSASGCGGGCGDRVYYTRHLIIIRNIADADINYTGCPASCPGEGALSTNIFRKPVR